MRFLVWVPLSLFLLNLVGPPPLIAQTRKPPVSDSLRPVIEKQGINAALALLADLKKNRPNDFDFSEDQLANLGWDLYSSQQYEAAAAIFSANIKAFPDRGNPHDGLGQALLAAGRHNEAIAAFEQALARSRKPVWYWNHMADAHIARKDRTATAAWIEKTLQTYGGEFDAWRCVTRTLAGLRWWSKLDAVFVRETKTYPHRAAAWDHWITSLAERGDDAAAKTKLAEALTRFDPVQFSHCRAAMAKLGAPLPEADDGWRRADPAAVGLDPAVFAALDKAVARGDFPHLRNLIVVVGDRLAVERNVNGGTRYRLHDPRSVGKSFTATLVGAAVDAGFLRGADEPVFRWFAKEIHKQDPAKDAVQLRHLLSMSPGLNAYDDRPSPGNENTFQQTNDWLNPIVNLGMAYTPGQEFVYTSAASMLAAHITERAVGEPLTAFAQRTFFKPLNIKSYQWMETPDGVLYGAGGLHLRARDMAKLGALYLNKGMWRGKRVLSEAWVQTASSKHITINDQRAYGFYWWISDYPHHQGKTRCFYASGNGGNRISVFPDLNVAVVITATAYGRRIGHQHADQILSKYVLPAVPKAASSPSVK